MRIKDGYKRVGLVVDYGTAADAPEGSTPPRREPVSKCVVVPVSATSADVLDEQRRTRVGSSGLLCAIDGYPAKGCGDVAEESSRPAETTPAPDSGSGSNTSTYLAVGAGVVIAVLLIAAMAARRRSGGG